MLLLRPAHPGAVAAEAIVRLDGELLAAGYTVAVSEIPEHGDIRAAMEPPARPPDADAVIALFGEGIDEAGLLWVRDRATGKTVTRPIPHEDEGPRSARILAVRALELLRASFLEAALGPARSEGATGPDIHPAPVPPVRGTVESDAGRPPPPRTPSHLDGAASRLAVEAGGLVMGSLDRMPPALLPLVRATVVPALRWPLLGRLTVAGLGTRARVGGGQGDAEVSHQLALVEGLLEFRRGRRWQPFLSIGAGVAYVSAEGIPAGGTGTTGRTVATWSFVADGGAGLRVALGPRVRVAGELHVERDAPYPIIRFHDRELATEGRPTVLGSLSLIAWL